MTQFKKLTALSLVLLTFGSGASAFADTFTQALKDPGAGFKLESAEEQALTLQEAKDYAQYRQMPDSTVGQNFISNCKLTYGNRFCLAATTKAESTAAADAIPKDTRLTFFRAVTSLDKVENRPTTCPKAVADLKAIVSKTKSSRLTARALYWQWVCSQVEPKNKNNKLDPAKTAALKEELWQKFPFAIQTMLVMEASADFRLQEIASREIDPEIKFRSEENIAMNPIIAGLEALIQIGEYGAAAVVESRFNNDILELEPEVQLYIVTLMNQVSRNVPSTLPMTRRLQPILNRMPELRSATLLRLLFPDDYDMKLIREARVVSFKDLLEDLRGNMEWSLLAGLIHHESALNPRASSPAKAYGLTQLLIPTAEDVYNTWPDRPLFPVSRDMLFDPKISIQLGVMDFDRRLNTFQGRLPLALASYLAGEKGVADWIAKSAPSITDERVLLDILFVNEERDSRISEYPAAIMGKAAWYNALYQR